MLCPFSMDIQFSQVLLLSTILKRVYHSVITVENLSAHCQVALQSDHSYLFSCGSLFNFHPRQDSILPVTFAADTSVTNERRNTAATAWTIVIDFIVTVYGYGWLKQISEWYGGLIGMRCDATFTTKRKGMDTLTISFGMTLSRGLYLCLFGWWM